MSKKNIKGKEDRMLIVGLFIGTSSMALTTAFLEYTKIVQYDWIDYLILGLLLNIGIWCVVPLSKNKFTKD